MTKHEEYCAVVLLGYEKSFSEWLAENFGDYRRGILPPVDEDEE